MSAFDRAAFPDAGANVPIAPKASHLWLFLETMGTMSQKTH
jgi:hypothetical protein